METYLQESITNLMKGYERKLMSASIKRGIKARKLRLEMEKKQKAKK